MRKATLAFLAALLALVACGDSNKQALLENATFITPLGNRGSVWLLKHVDPGDGCRNYVVAFEDENDWLEIHALPWNACPGDEEVIGK